MDNRPTLHYRRDITEAVGQIVGPNLLGELYVIDEVTTDGEVWTARLRNATTDDLEAARS